MMTSWSFRLSFAVLFGLVACSSDPGVDARSDSDPQMSKRVAIRVAGFVEAAGIT